MLLQALFVKSGASYPVPIKLNRAVNEAVRHLLYAVATTIICAGLIVFSLCVAMLPGERMEFWLTEQMEDLPADQLSHCANFTRSRERHTLLQLSVGHRERPIKKVSVTIGVS